MGKTDLDPTRTGRASAMLLAVTLALSACGGGGGGGSSSTPGGVSLLPGASKGGTTPGTGTGSAKKPTSPPPVPIGTGVVTTVGTSTDIPISLPAGVTAKTTTVADAARLLEQASFGPTETNITRVSQVGVEAYVESQFNLPVSGYTAFAYMPPDPPSNCTDNPKSANPPATMCRRDNYTLYQIQRQFLQNAIHAPDQLRQRVAFALSQILVISGTDINQAYAMREYQQMLLQNAFGNYRKILSDVTLSPAMGHYLSMVNNDKPSSPDESPNENYARELLQLFSIGLFKLNPDGTQQKDAQGVPIPSYDQNVIREFAKVFTGWTYAPRNGAAMRSHNPVNFAAPMVAVPDNHETSGKTLLDGATLPAGQTPEKDLSDALDMVFNHPNVGPFVGRQLIQHLVTSNPTPAYVARVTAAFNDNGQGVRGDMKAVLRAVLYDAEARGDVKTDANYGHLREPALFIAGLVRAMNGKTDGVALRGASRNMGQNVYTAPTVFNFYQPDYPLPGSATSAGPEFAIQDSTAALARVNFVNSMVYGTAPKADTTVGRAIGTNFDITPWQSLANDPPNLVERLNVLLLHGAMSPEMNNAILQAIAAAPAGDAAGRVRAALYLILGSPQFQVER